MKQYFITGTDTDCGKTYVTSKLTDFFPNAAAIKPIASGCMLVDNELISSDALQLKNNNLSLEQINPWRFKLPISPHLAARKEGVHLVIQDIADYCMNFQLKNIDTLFIEGAGGLMVPLNNNETWIDFLKITEIPVLLVVGVKLGCINHALLTETTLKTNNIKCAGWIANCLDPDMLALDENIDTLGRFLDMPLLGVIPYLGDITNISLI